MVCPKCKAPCKDELHCTGPKCTWRVCTSCEIVFNKVGHTMTWKHKELRNPTK